MSAHRFDVDSGLRDIFIEAASADGGSFLIDLLKGASYELLRARADEALSSDLLIKIIINQTEGSLTVVDNGFGVPSSDLEGFFKASDISKDSRFGLQSYSIFKVSDKVEVISKRSADEQYICTKSETGAYNLQPYAQEDEEDFDHGTKVVMHLKKKYSSYLLPSVIEDIVREHAELIDISVKLICINAGDAHTEKTLKPGLSVWIRNSEEASREDYVSLYRYLTKSTDEPLSIKTFSRNDEIPMFGVLFFSELPCHNKDKFGIKFYLNQVPVKSKLESYIEVLSQHLSGVIYLKDSSFSPFFKETLSYEDENIIDKCLDEVLSEWFEGIGKDDEMYKIIRPFIVHRSWRKGVFLGLLRFYSSKSEDKLTSLDEYISRMKKDQKVIYFAAGETIDAVKNSAFCENILQNDLELIYITNLKDKNAFRSNFAYKGYDFCFVTDRNAEIPLNKEYENKYEVAKRENLGACYNIQCLLSNCFVSLSRRLVNSPCCAFLSHVDEFDSGPSRCWTKGSNALLEMNPNHEIIQLIVDLTSDPGVNPELYAPAFHLLFETALIDSNYALSDTEGYSKFTYDLIQSSLGISKPAVPVLAGDKSGDL